MAIKSTGNNYKIPARDSVENFGGNQLVYVGWDRHMMFAAPFSFLAAPQMLFEQFFNETITPAFAIHPTWPEVTMADIQWLLNGEPFAPQLAASLCDQGIDHKSLLRMQTPTIKGYSGLDI